VQTGAVEMRQEGSDWAEWQLPSLIDVLVPTKPHHYRPAGSR